MDSDEEAAQTTADFVRNNKERRRSRLDDVSFGDDGKTRDSAGAARATEAYGPKQPKLSELPSRSNRPRSVHTWCTRWRRERPRRRPTPPPSTP